MATFQKIKFKNFVLLQRGFDLPKETRTDGQYPVIASTSINGYHDKFKVKAPCVTTGRSGALGEVLYIKQNCWPLNTTLWVKDFKDNDPKFVYFKLKILGLEKFNAGAGVPTLNRNHLDEMVLEIPDLPVQTRIASILSAYDDLIENNEKRIKALEEMAQLLYSEWFVKFKFPGHEKVKMVNSGTEHGIVPEGWEVKHLKDVANVISGYAFKSSDFQKTGIPVIKIKNINSDNTVSTDNTDFIAPALINEGLSKYSLKDGDIIVAMTGATAGKVGRISTSRVMMLNQRVAKIDPIKGYYSFVWGRIGTEDAKKELYRLAGGAAQPNMSGGQIENISLLVPTEKVVIQYENLIFPMLCKILLLQKCDQKLSKTRDLLIPQLVTGKREIK